jgi:hypothetical protein
MKEHIITLAALSLLASPAMAQPEQVCFTKALNGADISPPMCFVPEPISSSSDGQCEVVLIPSGGTKCVFDRPAPPVPLAPPTMVRPYVSNAPSLGRGGI